MLAERLESKKRDIYPREAMKRVQMLSYRPDQPADIIGSYSFRSQKHPGDIDMMNRVGEIFVVGEWHQATTAEAPVLVQQFVKRLQSIVAAVSSSSETFYLEVKAGYDWRALDMLAPIGDMHDGSFTPSHTLRASLAWARGRGHITAEAAAQIQESLDRGTPDYDFITAQLRKAYVLRWGADEVLAGQKLRGVGAGTSLFDAVYARGRRPTITKLDVVSNINGTFYELSTFYLLRELEPDGAHTYITALPSLEDITFDVEKMLFSPAWYNPFKAVKRMFVYARAMHRGMIPRRLSHAQLTSFLEAVLAFLGGEVAVFYQLKSELETLTVLLHDFRAKIGRLDALGRSAYDEIAAELDGMKSRIAQTSLPEEEVARIARVIDEALRAENYDSAIALLRPVLSLFSGIAKDAAVKWLAAQGLTPPSHALYPFLPSEEYVRHLNATTGPADPLLATQHRRTYDWSLRGAPVAAGFYNVMNGGNMLGVCPDADARAKLAGILLTLQSNMHE